MTIVSNQISSHFLWSVKDDTGGSDHFPIRLTSAGRNSEITMRQKWKYSEADWTTFEQIVEQSIPSNRCISLEEFENVVRNAAEKTIPRTNITPGRKAVPWWSKEVAIAVKTRRKNYEH